MKKLVFFAILMLFCAQAVFSQQFKTHAVKEGETIESIAELYNIRTADILRLNPELKGGKLKVNTILVILASSDENDGPVKNEVTLNQQVTFKQHKVKRRETLFSISQKYDIEIEDIKRYNKELYRRELKKGERIRIPKFLKPVVAEEATDTIPEGLVRYTVKPKQGKWRIAYEHGITVKQLEEINPEMGEMLKDGEEILVPARDETDRNVVIDTLYNYYTVKPREGFFRLKVKLGLTEDEIRELNPELQNGEYLKEGMILKIPKGSEGNFDVKDGLIVERFSLLDSINTSKTSNIAILMPLRLNLIETDSLEGIKAKIKGNGLLSRSLNFYAGAMMALDSAKQLGLSVNVEIYDSERNSNVVSNIIATNDFQNTDAVIGPFFSAPFNVVSGGLSSLNIPVFAPFTKNLERNPNVFQTLPSDEVLYNKMVTFLDDKIEGKNIIIIADSLHIPTRDRLLLRYPTAKIVDPVENQFIRIDELQPALDFERENWVIVETRKVSLLANITSVLNSAMKIIEEKDDEEKIEHDVAIRMFTTNKNNAYDSDAISNFYLSNLQFHFPSVDRFSPTDSDFSRSFERKYGSLPNRFAIRGFDITMDVILRLAYKENLYLGASLISETEYIENKFNYNENNYGGYTNTAVYLGYYEDLEIKLVKENDIESNIQGQFKD